MLSQDQNQKASKHYAHLKQKWTAHHKKLQKKLWRKHKDSLNWLLDNSKQLAVGSLGSLMLLTTPSAIALSSPHALISSAQITKNIEKSVFLVSDLSNLLPKEVQPLTPQEEELIVQTLTRHFGFKITPVLNKIRLNRSYGFIGQEQHLARFPGDNLASHFDSEEEAKMFSSAGMAPGLGAWGYFAPSKVEFTDKDKMREKYYIAVQTFLAPGFNEHVKEYVDFFKYRKMLVVNPTNGRVMAVVIGDAGPAQWTGKHLGGSPEVMRYLERADGSQRGPVLYFFIDDPEDKIPLGPIGV